MSPDDLGSLVKEKQTLEEIDRRVSVGADFLASLDRYTSRNAINSEGKVVMGATSEEQFTGRDLYFTKERNTLLERFAVGNNRSAEQYRSTEGILDAQVVNGCVVVVYDSSKILPIGFSSDSERGAHEGPTDFWTKDSDSKAQIMYRLGLVTVDLNPAKRKDGVDPSTSLKHELSHHNLLITDTILSEDQQLYMVSANRAGRKIALYGAERNRLTTEASYQLDSEKYELLYGRKSAEIQLLDIEAQLGYLDELHSSVLQRKAGWVNAASNVYNNRGGATGKHWEVVGSHPEDQNAARGLLKYIQAVYLTERALDGFDKSNPGEGQKKLLVDVPNLMNKICGIAGASRSVLQAERLIAQEWQAFAQSELGQKMINSSHFVQWRESIYKDSPSWGVDGLKSIFEPVN